MIFVSLFSQEDELVYKDLGTALKNPEKVLTLDLSNKNLETIPAAVLKFTNLKELNLSGNRLTNLPYYIVELENLEILDISKMPYLNLVDAFEKISGMKNLKDLKFHESGGKLPRKRKINNYKLNKIIISCNKST